jgi:hypothetical protein
MRITKEVLEEKVNNINTVLELTENGQFVLNWAYGGVALEQRTKLSQGRLMVTQISDRTNNANMAMILDAIENTIYATMC